jgi:hypothetical protein
VVFGRTFWSATVTWVKSDEKVLPVYLENLASMIYPGGPFCRCRRRLVAAEGKEDYPKKAIHYVFSSYHDDA